MWALTSSLRTIRCQCSLGTVVWGNRTGSATRRRRRPRLRIRAPVVRTGFPRDSRALRRAPGSSQESARPRCARRRPRSRCPRRTRSRTRPRRRSGCSTPSPPRRSGLVPGPIPADPVTFPADLEVQTVQVDQAKVGVVVELPVSSVVEAGNPPHRPGGERRLVVRAVGEPVAALVEDRPARVIRLLPVHHVQDLVADAVHPPVCELVEVVAEGAPLRSRCDDLVDVRDQDHVVSALEELVLESLDGLDHPGVVDRVVVNGPADEPVPIGGPVGRVVVEDVEVIRRKEAGIVVEPNRQEDRLVVDDGDRGAPLVRAERPQPASVRPVGPDRLPELAERRLGVLMNLRNSDRGREDGEIVGRSAAQGRRAYIIRTGVPRIVGSSARVTRKPLASSWPTVSSWRSLSRCSSATT